jgi:hypothetical protein
LSIVGAIVDAHGGAVRVLETTAGTTIEVRVPAADATPPVPPPP